MELIFNSVRTYIPTGDGPGSNERRACAHYQTISKYYCNKIQWQGVRGRQTAERRYKWKGATALLRPLALIHSTVPSKLLGINLTAVQSSTRLQVVRSLFDCSSPRLQLCRCGQDRRLPAVCYTQFDVMVRASLFNLSAYRCWAM